MALSVHTNSGALVALQALNKTNAQLDATTLKISTGFRVNGAKDDASTFAIAQRMRADVAGLGSVRIRLAEGIATLDTAISAAETISDLLIEMKAKAVQGNQAGLTTSTHNALDADFQAVLNQITSVVSTAAFNGLNLVEASAGTFKVLSDINGATLNFTPGHLDIGTLGLSGTSLITAANSASAVAAVDAAIDTVNLEIANQGAFSRALGIQNTFITKLTDTLATGIGNLVDADLTHESAKLQSLQIRQQLGVQALSIANRSPQTVLGLFG